MEALSAEELFQKGMSYLNTNEGEAGKKKAVEYFEQAIELGSIAAKRELATILLGDTFAWDAKTDAEKKGVQLYEEAAAEGDKQAKEWYVLQFYDRSIFRWIKSSESKRKHAIAKKYLEELHNLKDC